VTCFASYLWKSFNFMHLCHLCFMCLTLPLFVQENTSKDHKSTKVQKLTRFKRVSSLKRDSFRANTPSARFQPDPESKPTRLKRVLSRANSLQARFKQVKRIRDTWSSSIGAEWTACNSLQAS